MSSNSLNNQEINFLGKEEEEIDLDSLKNFFIRRKKVILTFSGIGLIVGIYIGLTSPKIWEGRFQIVLENKQKKPIIDSEKSPIPASLFTKNSSLKTEIEILKSPSVLFDIFNYVKIQKNLLYPNGGEGLKYDGWLENLEVKLKKSTSVLNLSYRDKDKEIILPVLKKISNTYQDYSGSKGLLNIELGLDYVNKEIEIYNKKSFLSFIKAQNYAKENNLDILYDKPNPNIFRNERGKVPYQFDLERIRIRDASIVENINAKLNLIETYKENPKKKLDLILKIAKDYEISDFSSLKKLEDELTYNLAIYKEHDPIIKRLLSQKEIILKNLENSVISNLSSNKELLEIKIKLSSRPQEVINKYRQLLSQALRDQASLEKLENEKSFLTLSKSRKNIPWKLITKPTLLDQPVSQSRKKILLFEVLKFSIVGILVGFILDKKDGLLHSKKKIEQLLNCNLIQELKTENQENWDDILYLSLDELINIDSLSLITLGNINQEYTNKILNSLKKSFKKDEIKITNNLIESVKFKAQLIIVSPGNVKREQILELNKFFSLTKSNLIGFFLLN